MELYPGHIYYFCFGLNTPENSKILYTYVCHTTSSLQYIFYTTWLIIIYILLYGIGRLFFVLSYIQLCYIQNAKLWIMYFYSKPESFPSVLHQTNTIWILLHLFIVNKDIEGTFISNYIGTSSLGAIFLLYAGGYFWIYFIPGCMQHFVSKWFHGQLQTRGYFGGLLCPIKYGA